MCLLLATYMLIIYSPQLTNTNIYQNRWNENNYYFKSSKLENVKVSKILTGHNKGSKIWPVFSYQCHYCSRLHDIAPRIIEQSSIVHTCAEVDYHIYIYFIDRSPKILLSSGYGVGPPFSRRVSEMVQILTGAIYM